MQNGYIIREAHEAEYEAIGNILVKTYSRLKGFPTPADQPKYYDKLRHIHHLLTNDSIVLLVAIDSTNTILGAVLFFSDMQYYGSRGAAMSIKNASGFRFLGVTPEAQGLGIGKALSLACIDKAKALGLEKVIIHSTDAMKTAWRLYQKLGFKRTLELDFSWDGYRVYGFELRL